MFYEAGYAALAERYVLFFRHRTLSVGAEESRARGGLAIIGGSGLIITGTSVHIHQKTKRGKSDYFKHLPCCFN